jgi:hypothetical protein
VHCDMSPLSSCAILRFLERTRVGRQCGERLFHLVYIQPVVVLIGHVLLRLCQRHWCSAVIKLRLVVAACARMVPALTLPAAAAAERIACFLHWSRACDSSSAGAAVMLVARAPLAFFGTFDLSAHSQ